MRVVAVLLAAKWLARLIATVVFPAPPFGFITSVVFILITGDPHPFYCATLVIMRPDRTKCKRAEAIVPFACSVSPPTVFPHDDPSLRPDSTEDMLHVRCE